MTVVDAKLSEARDLLAKLKVEHDPVKRIDLSRAFRIAAEDLRDAVANANRTQTGATSRVSQPRSLDPQHGRDILQDVLKLLADRGIDESSLQGEGPRGLTDFYSSPLWRLRAAFFRGQKPDGGQHNLLESEILDSPQAHEAATRYFYLAHHGSGALVSASDLYEVVEVDGRPALRPFDVEASESPSGAPGPTQPPD